LKVVKPFLPEFINQVELRHLRIGKAAVDLRFERKADGSLQTHVGQVTGDVQVEIEG
jgi:hypothetical protein